MNTTLPGTRRNPRKTEPGLPPKLFFGIALIAVGVAFLLERADIVQDAGQIFDYWPALLILAGVGKLLYPGSSSGLWTGGILIAVGGWLLADNLGLIDVSFWDWWPLVLVVVGVRMIYVGFQTRPSVAADSASTVNAVAVLGGSTRSSNTADFQGGDLIAFMGGCEIDLTQAKIASSPAVIDALAFWGGVDIRVPRNWEVVVKGVPLLGGYEDKTRFEEDDSEIDEPHQQLVVKGFAIMGGVEVKN